MMEKKVTNIVINQYFHKLFVIHFESKIKIQTTVDN